VTDLAREWATGAGWDIASVVDRPDGILVRATGPLPEPETDSLRIALADAGLSDADVAIELIPSHTVALTPEPG
jgi:hypothetical protein